MRIFGVPLLGMTSITLMAVSEAALAAGQVRLELITDQQAPITAQQQWLRTLSEVGIDNLRIRSGRSTDKVGVEVTGTDASPIYVVTGLIKSSDELILPGGRFRASDSGRIVAYLNNLAARGTAQGGPQKAAFGLDFRQFQEVHTDLATPLAFPTDDMTRGELVRRAAGRLSLALKADPGVLRAAEDEQVSTDLAKLSAGTALAYALRAPGLCLVPRRGARGTPELVIAQAKEDMEVWPIGWEPDKPDREVLPGLYEFLNVNVQGVPVTKVLDAVAGRLELPVLLDHNAMARHGIEPEKTTVNLPQSRTTYSLLLRKALFQARLKSEVRVDEAGQPFLWVTTVKPLR